MTIGIKVIEVTADVHFPAPSANGDLRPEVARNKGPSPTPEEADAIQVQEVVTVVTEEEEGEATTDKPKEEAEGENLQDSKAEEGKVDGTEAMTLVENETDSKTSSENPPPIEEEKKQVKVSSKLFKKSGGGAAKRKKSGAAVSNTTTVPPPIDDESRDFDFLQVKKGSGDETPAALEEPTKKDDTAEREEEDSPELFKHRPKRPRRRRGAKREEVNNCYDSDSIDLDALSRIVDRDVGAAASAGMASSAGNASFTALIEKPLAPAYAEKEEAKVVKKVDTEEKALPEKKEAKTPSANVVAKKPNAFDKLMSLARLDASKSSAKAEAEEADRTTKAEGEKEEKDKTKEDMGGLLEGEVKVVENEGVAEDSQETQPAPKRARRKGRPRKSENAKKAACEKAVQEKETDAEVMKKKTESEKTATPKRRGRSPKGSEKPQEEESSITKEASVNGETESEPCNGGGAVNVVIFSDSAVQLEATTPPVTPKRRGRPRGSKTVVRNREAFLREDSTCSSNSTTQDEDDKEAEVPSSPAAGRRMSSRLQKKKSSEEELQRKRDELEASIQVGKEPKCGGTPKGKRRREKKSKSKKAENGDEDEISIEHVVIATPPRRRSPVKIPAAAMQQQKQNKLAPIFMSKKQREAAARAVLPAEDPAKAAAREAFLKSSVPDELKARVTSAAAAQREEELAALDSPAFSDIGHVRQEDKESTLERPGPSRLNLKEKEDGDTAVVTGASELSRGHVTGLSKDPSSDEAPLPASLPQEEDRVKMNPAQIYNYYRSLRLAGGGGGGGTVLSVKRSLRRFIERKVDSDTLEEEAFKKNINLNDIEETRMLRGGRRRHRSKREKKKAKKGEGEEPKKVAFDPDVKSSMQWTMKYAPESAEDIIGNTKAVRELQTWLEGWMTRRKSKNKSKNKSKRGGKKKRKDDFIASSSEDDDSSYTSSSCSSSDSEDEEDCISDNTALLVGPSGAGKTASVYALAGQLGFKVLEVNASSCRGGRHVTAQLQEATQSHHLQGGKKGQAVVPPSKKKRKKDSSMVPSLKRTALILFEDVDLTFGEGDDGFYAAVSALAATTKRPIVLTTSDPHFYARRLLRMREEPRVLRFRRPSDSASASRHLQLLCLAEGVPLCSSAAECLLSRGGGSVARAVLEAQFWALSAPPVLEVPREEEESEEEESVVVHRGRSRKLDVSTEEEEEKATAKEADKEDDLLALMSLTEKSLAARSCRPVSTFSDCVSGMLGEENSPTRSHHALASRPLFDDGDRGRALLETSLLWLLPFAREFQSCSPRKGFVPSEEECRRFRRIINYDFLQQSSEEDEEEGDSQKDKPKEEEEQKPSKEERSNAKMGLEAMLSCAEARSAFSLPTSSIGEAEPSSSTSRDISYEVQTRTVTKASMEVEAALPGQVRSELTVSVRDDVGDPFSSLSAAYRARDLDQVGTASEEEDATVRAALEPSLSPPWHYTEALPVLRTMARSEEARRAGGDAAKSRSGRFHHYLESQEIYLEPVELRALCDALQD